MSRNRAAGKKLPVALPPPPQIASLHAKIRLPLHEAQEAQHCRGLGLECGSVLDAQKPALCGRCTLQSVAFSV